MRVYKAEKDAGIDFQMNRAGSSSSFVMAQVRIGDIKKYFDDISVIDLVKSTSTVQSVEELLGNKQPDLALVVAILVSTGWNLNDDIFTPEEVWKARLSPLHKPMNDHHQAKKILGHIVQTRVLDKSGTEINVNDGESLPTEFDIEVAGVLYRAVSELSERINEIIEKAKIGEMFVSMEALFPDFGYGLMDSTTADIKLVERNESTAFLTKHLREYGGSGKYRGYRVGRVLKDIIFSAQGFVNTPANPESVIKVAANKVAASRIFVTAELSNLLEGGVEDVDEKQLQELHTRLEEARASLESRDREIVELQKVAKEFAAKDYDGQIVALSAKVEELEVEKVELQKQFDEMTKRAEKSKAELDGIRKTETARERLVKLSKVKDIDDEDVTMAELRGMTSETFEVVLKYAGEVKSEEPEMKADATDTDTKSKTTQEKEAEQAEGALNDVEEEDSADFNASEDAVGSEADQWMSTAKALCGREDEKDEGGE